MSGEDERGIRFARDLHRIRRDRGVSLTDIHDATKMAYDLIKRFEHDSLIGHAQFNRVYLRLFVRGYAEYLNMDVEMALEAFELAMKGQYTGSLAKAYLGESGEEDREESPKQEKKTGRKKPAPPGPDQGTEATPSAQTGQESAEIPYEKSAGPARQIDSEAPESAATVPAVSSTEQPATREASSPKVPSTRRTSAGTSSGANPSTGAAVQKPAGSGSGSGPDPRWIFLGLLVVVIGLGVWGLNRAGSGSDGLSQELPPPAESVAPANDIPRQSLPDTLNVAIVADKGSVAPIRVTVDSDLRRPYWIERGDSMTFRMADRIMLEQQLDSITVQVEGMTYPVSRPAGEDMVVLTRDALRSWFSSIQR